MQPNLKAVTCVLLRMSAIHNMHQPRGWMRNNVGLVLKLQLIVGDLSLIFSANEWQMSVHVLSVEPHDLQT